MFIKLPYKIEPKNICDIIKECFGIEKSTRETRDIFQLEEIIIHEEPKREKRYERKKIREKREEQIRQTSKIYRERLDIPVNKYLMVDASTTTDDLENEVISSLFSLPKDAHDYIFLE